MCGVLVSLFINTMVLVIMCVLQADLSMSHALPAGNLGFKTRFLQDGHQVDGTLKASRIRHAAFNLKTNGFMHARNYVDNLQKL